MRFTVNRTCRPSLPRKCFRTSKLIDAAFFLLTQCEAVITNFSVIMLAPQNGEFPIPLERAVSQGNSLLLAIVPPTILVLNFEIPQIGSFKPTFSESVLTGLLTVIGGLVEGEVGFEGFGVGPGEGLMAGFGVDGVVGLRVGVVVGCVVGLGLGIDIGR